MIERRTDELHTEFFDHLLSTVEYCRVAYMPPEILRPMYGAWHLHVSEYRYWPFIIISSLLQSLVRPLNIMPTEWW